MLMRPQAAEHPGADRRAAQKIRVANPQHGCEIQDYRAHTDKGENTQGYGAHSE